MINGIKLFELNKYVDNRGSFVETFREEILPIRFVQENESCSKKNVLRGLHYQKKHPQAKFVRVIKGKILDVCVDLDKNSETFLNYLSVELNPSNAIFIPKYCAHGFLSLEDDTIVSYKCSDYYYADDQFGIIWNDDTLNIKWGIENPILSDKDKGLPFFKTIKENIYA